MPVSIGNIPLHTIRNKIQDILKILIIPQYHAIMTLN